MRKNSALGNAGFGSNGFRRDQFQAVSLAEIHGGLQHTGPRGNAALLWFSCHVTSKMTAVNYFLTFEHNSVKK